MKLRLPAAAIRWVLALGCLAAIVSLYRHWLHVNTTTVALTLLLYILLLAARWSLRYPLVMAVLATTCYNYYFLPPVGTFTIADPQNWLALFAFLATALIGSRLSQKAREEAHEAGSRRSEIEGLLNLSRGLLATENVATLVNGVPEIIRSSTGAAAVVLYLLEGDRIYRAGLDQLMELDSAGLRLLALGAVEPEMVRGGQMRIPLQAGVRPRGLIVLGGVQLALGSCKALGGLVSIALDRAQALEEAAKSEASRESERLRTLILDSIAHELRTPLTSIKGAAGALLSVDQVPDESRRELLTIVDEEADRLNRLVGQAVEMAQLESQQVHMSFAPVDVAHVVDQARSTCSWVANAHPVSINLPELPKVTADPEMIGKVLCNLLENAAKYSEEGSPIFVSGEYRDGYVYTSVADRGIGIDAAEQGLVFDRLFRSGSVGGKVPGTGMGLAISRAIVEAHRGALTVTSQPQHGSVFTFSLPAAFG